jgi:hypothetical protein
VSTLPRTTLKDLQSLELLQRTSLVQKQTKAPSMPVSEHWIGRVHRAGNGRRALSSSRRSLGWNGRFHDGRPLLRSKSMGNPKSQDREVAARKIKRAVTSPARRVTTVLAILISAVLRVLTQAHRLRLYLLRLRWHSVHVLLSIVLVDEF